MFHEIPETMRTRLQEQVPGVDDMRVLFTGDLYPFMDQVGALRQRYVVFHRAATRQSSTTNCRTSARDLFAEGNERLHLTGVTVQPEDVDLDTCRDRVLFIRKMFKVWRDSFAFRLAHVGDDAVLYTPGAEPIVIAPLHDHSGSHTGITIHPYFQREFDEDPTLMSYHVHGWLEAIRRFAAARIKRKLAVYG